MSLEGKIALVTGSGRNMGRATALELARKGANVVINARANRDEAESVAREARELGADALAVLADVGIEEQAQDLIGQTVSAFGRIDVLVNNAGLRESRPITEMTTEEWRRVLRVNLDGPFYLSRAAIPHMIAHKGGRIISVAGVHAFTGQAEWAHVCASKMGAVGLTRALARELAPHNILVNHIVPGAFDTIRETDEARASIAALIPEIPLGRLGLPDEVARTIAFLASDEASYITGQTIHINGGLFSG
jgi:3-oxoacyl-[acyl-carrier protein] reductase